MKFLLPIHVLFLTVIELFLLLLFLPEFECARFLFTFFHDRGSHFGSMKPMMEMLAERGHSVAFLDTISIEGVSPTIRAIRYSLPKPNDDKSKDEFAKIFWHDTLRASNLAFYYSHMDNLFGELLVNGSEKISELTDTDWDFIVIDDLFWSFGFALTTLKHRLWELAGKKGRQPHIIVYATAAQSLLSAESTRSTGRNWVSRAPFCPQLPTNEKDVYSPEKFSDRMSAFHAMLAEFLIINFVVPHLMPYIATFGVSDFSWAELYSRTALQFADSVDRMGWPSSVGVEVKNVGAHCKRVRDLPKEFADFVEARESRGTIYAAFGTHADWSRAPKRVSDAMLGAFRRLSDYRVIFVYNGPAVPNLGKHVLLTKWAPQLEILAHSKTMLFISHAGNKSIREALCAGIPLITMPLYAEQAHSAHLLLKSGFAPTINKFTLTEEGVYNTISEVLQNPERGRRARKFRKMFLDRPMPSMEEGVFAAERLLRKDADRWRQFSQRRGIHLGWPEFVYVDLIFVLVALIFMLSSAK